MTLFNRFWRILTEVYETMQQHGKQDEVDMLTSVGIYHKDKKSHVHANRSQK